MDYLHLDQGILERAFQDMQESLVCFGNGWACLKKSSFAVAVGAHTLEVPTFLVTMDHGL